jgi:DNA-binding MarR family transcriptional regulator
MSNASEEDDDLPPEQTAAVDLGPLAGLIGYALRRAQLSIFADFRRTLAAHDIRAPQYSVLQVIKHNPGLRQTQVGFALGIRRTNFVPLLDELEARGLAERRSIRGDRRSKGLFLTASGAVLLDTLDQLVAGHEARFANWLGPDGKRHLLGLLHRLTDRAFDPDV